jgi:two-component system chemotaxis response regulator CheB
MAHGRRTRILIVDDSAVMRSLLRSVVCADASLEVAGTAVDGESALSAIATLCPDLVLLDVEMPVMDGLITLRQLRARGNKMPVIMCSSLTQRGAMVTIEALASGASDYVTKPAGQASREAATRTLAQELVPKIHALTGRLPTQPVFQGAARMPLALPVASHKPQIVSSVPVVLTIGVSTGGPAALDVLLPALPGNFPLPVLIVQHMPELFTKLFAERLDGHCRLRVREAAEGDPVRAGTIYIARGNWHMEVLCAARSSQPGQAPTLHLHQGPLENHCRPAVDALFRSAAAVYGSGVLAVVLTGMGSDGLLGCRTIRDHGGTVLAQDEATSTVWGMPGAVANAGLAHNVLPLHAIVPEILRIVSRTNRSEARELLKSAV